MESKQIVSIVTKPRMEEDKEVGLLITYLEQAGFRLSYVAPRVKLGLPAIKDLYAIIGMEMTEKDERSWSSESGFSFVFSFYADDGHNLIEQIAPQKKFPVVYIKKDSL